MPASKEVGRANNNALTTMRPSSFVHTLSKLDGPSSETARYNGLTGNGSWTVLSVRFTER